MRDYQQITQKLHAVLAKVIYYNIVTFEVIEFKISLFYMRFWGSSMCTSTD